MTDYIDGVGSEIIYYSGTNHNSFRPNEFAMILGVGGFTKPDGKIVPCFYVRYADGKKDYCPISDYNNYKICTEEEVRLSYIPSV